MGPGGRLASLAPVVLVGCWGWAVQADAFVYGGNFGTGTIARANLDGFGTGARSIACPAGTRRQWPALRTINLRHLAMGSVFRRSTPRSAGAWARST